MIKSMLEVMGGLAILAFTCWLCYWLSIIMTVAMPLILVWGALWALSQLFSND